jgi:hypothetical protein
MNSGRSGRCERWGGGSPRRGCSNPLSAQGLESWSATHEGSWASAFGQPFVFPWQSIGVAGSYTVGHSAFGRTRLH